MKNVITAAALAAVTATSAMANSAIYQGPQTTYWNGTAPETLFEDTCEFYENIPGTMRYDIETGVWSTKGPVDTYADNAIVRVKTRGVTEVMAEPTDYKLREQFTDAEVGNVTIDYKGYSRASDIGTLHTDGSPKNYIGKSKLRVWDLDRGETDDNFIPGPGSNTAAYTNVLVRIGGTATMEDTNIETNGIKESGKYYISHTVTCLQ